MIPNSGRRNFNCPLILKFNGRVEIILIVTYMKPLVNNPDQIIYGLRLPSIGKVEQAVSFKKASI